MIWKQASQKFWNHPYSWLGEMKARLMQEIPFCFIIHTKFVAPQPREMPEVLT